MSAALYACTAVFGAAAWATPLLWGFTAPKLLVAMVIGAYFTTLPWRWAVVHVPRRDRPAVHTRCRCTTPTPSCPSARTSTRSTCVCCASLIRDRRAGDQAARAGAVDCRVAVAVAAAAAALGPARQSLAGAHAGRRALLPRHGTAALGTGARSPAQCRMVVASMSAQPYRLTSLHLLAPLPLLCATPALGLAPELVLHVYAAVAVAVQTQYWVGVVKEISAFLNISVFSIKPKQ